MRNKNKIPQQMHLAGKTASFSGKLMKLWQRDRENSI